LAASLHQAGLYLGRPGRGGEDRALRGDREKAQTLPREALEAYSQIGMPRHGEMTQTLLDRAAANKS